MTRGVAVAVAALVSCAPFRVQIEGVPSKFEVVEAKPCVCPPVPPPPSCVLVPGK